MATINLGKVITDQQKAVLDRVSYNSTDNQLETSVKLAPTVLEQQEANYAYDLPYNFSAGSNFTCENVYVRVQIINNILYLIANINVTNTSGSTANLWSAGVSCWIKPPYSEKIIDAEGNSVAQSLAQPVLITATHGFYATDLSTNGYLKPVNFAIHNNDTAEYILLTFKSGTGDNTPIAENIPAGQKLYLTARVELTLI